MTLKKVCILLSVIVVVFLAGCAKQVSVATAGVVIEKFTSQISTVASNSPVELTLIVKNIGEREAKDVKAVLGGLTFLPDSVSSGSEEAQKYWKLGSGERILKNLDPSSLLGEDTEIGFKGDQGITTWRLTAPVQAHDQSYEPTVNLVYTYSTISTILIKAVNFDYFQSLSKSEQASSDTGIIVSKTTKGPIEIFVKSDQAVISGSSTLPIEIEFKNVGGGRTFFGGESETDPTRLYDSIKNGLDKISVDLPDMQCNLKPDPTTKKYEIRLIEGKNGRILCNKVIGGISTIQTFSLDVTAEYRYLVEGKTTVRISRTVYQPPIVDISLEDSSVTIEHYHSSSTFAILDFKIKNVGNQPVSGTDVKVKYKIPEAGITDRLTDKPVLSADTKLESFSASSLTGVRESISNKEKVTVEMETVPLTLPELKNTDGTTKQIAELNDKDNKKSETIPLDYDIGVLDLKAEVIDISKFTTKITANVKNYAKNVDGINIPITVTIDGKGDEISCEVGTQTTDNNKVIIDKLEREKDKNVICIYQNAKSKLSFNIKASVEKSSSIDIKLTNDYNDKPNEKPNPFEINYDVAVLGSKSTFLKFDTDGTTTIYQLSTTVKNVGNVIVKGSDLAVSFIDNQGLPFHTDCISLKINEAELQPQQQSSPVTCEYKTKEPKTLAKAKVTTNLPETKIDNNIDTKSFEISIKYDVAILRGSSKREVKTVVGNKVTYTLSTKIVNEGDVEAKNLQVKFTDKDGNSLCESDIPLFDLQPNAIVEKSCIKSLLTTDIVQAKAVVIGLDTESDKADNEEPLKIFYEDKTPPPSVKEVEIYLGTIYPTEKATAIWYKGTINIQAKVDDDPESGISKCEYTIDNGATWKQTTTLYSAGYCKEENLDTKKDITINFRATNGAGLTTVGTSKNYKYDGTAPATSLRVIAVVTGKPLYTPGTWTAAEGLEVTLSCTDNSGGVGCLIGSTKYCIDKPGATSTCTPDITYSQTFQITTSKVFIEGDLLKLSEGVTYLRYASADNLGNTETKFEEIKIDNTEPDAADVVVSYPGEGGGFYKSNTNKEGYLYFAGTAKDKFSYGSGFGANSVKFYIKRASDNNYWTGSGWSTSLTWLSTSHDATTGDTPVNWRGIATLPKPSDWAIEQYSARARVIDKAGNVVINPVDKSEG